MRFTFTEDQRLFQRAVRDLLAKEFPPEALRAAWQNADPAARAREDGARRLFRVRWTPAPATRLEVDAAQLEAAFDRGALGVAAQLLGLADRMIEMATDYARQREQFGKPIGSFQAVKHLLADALLQV